MATVAHEDVIPMLADHLRPVFGSSPERVYVRLGEEHRTCDENLARLSGYRVAELENTPSLLQRVVHEVHQEHPSGNDSNRVRPLAFPATSRFPRVRSDGSILQAELA